MFAIMIENDSGEYEEYTVSSVWPTGMIFNEENSGCVDGDGNTVNATLSYSDGYVSVSTNDTIYCYLYFDMDNGWCLNNGITNLAECILRSENNFDSEEEAIEYIKNEKGTPDFSATATDDEGLYYAEDDYDDSYYFRGSVTDNYVYFAGYYWRIIRINGDGSIRMIYDGTSAYANGTSSTDRYISTSVFNTLGGSNALVGYMYGEAFTENATTETTLTLQSYYFYYASTYTFDTDTGYFILGDDASQQVWNSSLAGYYTCRSTSTTCTTLYYIDSYTNIYQGKYYTYTRTSETDENNVTTYTESQGTTTSSATFATRNYYGTGYSYDSSNGYTLTSYAYNVYDGTGNVTDLTDYYTCGSTSYYGCTTMYHIESGSTAQVANVTKYTLTTNDYATAHENKNDSTIKTVVDNWYATNIYNKTDGTNSYDDYISDTLFCNDRSFTSGTGTGKSQTYYGAYTRLITNKSPVLTCTNQNDRFTVDDEVNGNGDLTYKVGLITADEVWMAGAATSFNSSYYLYIGQYFWTMSPSYFTGTGAGEWPVTSLGHLYTDNRVFNSDGVRPVINLSSSVILTSGDGTMDSPFIVTLD